MVAATSPPQSVRVRRAELLSAASALALLALMFLVQWYGITPGSTRLALPSAHASVENAWHALSLLRWLMLATIVVALGAVFLHATQRSHGTQTDTSRIVTALGAITSGWLVYRVLIDLPASDRVVDQKLGALLGLLSALGIAFGGYQAAREQHGLARTVTHRGSRP